MLTTLWIIFLSTLRIFFKIIVFIPRYIFIERHDTRSAVWGSRAEAIVSFPFSSWAHDVVRRIDCLRCLKKAPVDAPSLSSTLTSFPSSRTRRITLAEVSDEESELAEATPPPEKPTTVVRHLSRWIHGTTTQLLRTERDNLFPSDKNNNNNNNNHNHHNHHEDNNHNNSNNGRIPISMDEDEDDMNEDDICSAAAMVCPHALQGVFTTGVSVSLRARHTRAVPISRTRPCLPAKGFVPPFYAVDAKAQLLMALIDPLARIASELFVRTGIAARVQALRRLRISPLGAKDSAVPFAVAPLPPAPLPREECGHSAVHSPPPRRLREEEEEEGATATAAAGGGGGPQATRVASVRWLTAPPPADGAAPAVVLLLCPSVAHGGAAGRVARRVAALCAALSAVATARREALGPQRHHSGEHWGQKAHAEPSAPRDARLATWHVAVPAVELRRGAAAQAKGPAAETAAVSVADVERIIAHLRARLHAVAVVPEERSCPAALPATRAPTADDILSYTGTEESAEVINDAKSGTEAQGDTGADKAGHTVSRSVYIVGVGWSNASGPLLQYVIAHGAHARMDGLISIGHTLSSNYGLLHDTHTHPHAHNTATSATGGSVKTQRMPGVECDARDTAEAQRATDALALPFTRALLHERSGTVRLLLLAARLEMIAESLQSANRAGLNDAPSTCARVALPAAIVKSRTTEDQTKGETEAASESHNMRLRKRATFHASLTSSLLSSASSAPPHDFLNALAHADARADREVKRWWLDAAGSPRSPLTSANRMSVGAHRTICPMPMPNFMSIPIPAAPGPHGLPLSPHGEWDTLFSPPSRDDMSWSLVTGATAGRENFAASVTEVFEMARGMSVSHTALAGIEGAALRAAATAATTTAAAAAAAPPGGGSGGSRISKIELQYRSTQSARVIGCIRVPTLFLHALDDATAPFSTLPMEALATNPKIFTVLTRRGGHGVYLEGVADFFVMPRLTQRPQQKATQREKWKAKVVQMWRGARPTVEATMSTEDDDNEVKTQLVIEGTTWVERLIVEFVSSAILSSPPRS